MRVLASLSGGVTAAKKRTVEQLKLTEHVWCRYQGRNPESHGSHDVRFWHFADINSTLNMSAFRGRIRQQTRCRTMLEWRPLTPWKMCRRLNFGG
jgi:hypothetical protein